VKLPRRAFAALLAGLAAAAPSRADDPPFIEHQPSACTVPERPLSLCASISDDGTVAKARVYFRKAGDDFYSFVEMAFGGINFCGTVPGPRDGKVKAIEYYVQAMDDQFQPQRTSTFQVNVQPEGVCEFPPVEKDARRSAAIKVYATHKKQGSKMPADFQADGVTFVPMAGK
jgi:hypothetical protein